MKNSLTRSPFRLLLALAVLMALALLAGSPTSRPATAQDGPRPVVREVRGGTGLVRDTD